MKFSNYYYLLSLRINKLITSLSFRQLRRLLFYGIAPSVEHSFVLREFSSQCSFILDVGANVGQFLLASHLFDTNKPIYSFEPYKTAFDKLVIASSCHHNAHLFNYGLSDRDEVCNLFA